MVISFIGSGKLARRFAKHFAKNDMPVTLGGFYDLPAKSAAEAAVEFKATLYTKIDNLVENSDIICIAVPEDKIPRTVGALKYNHTHGKIIFHMSRKYASDVLDTGYENTIAAIYSTANVYTTLPAGIAGIPYIIEGEGKKLEDFKDILKKCGLNIEICDRKRAEIFIAASNILEMNIFAAIANAETAIKASTGLSIRNSSSLILHNVNAMLTNPNAYMQLNIQPYLTAAGTAAKLADINKLDMPEYLKCSALSAQICSEKSALKNDDKYEIQIAVKKFIK